MEIRQFLALWKILAPAAGPFREEAAHGEGQDLDSFDMLSSPSTASVMAALEDSHHLRLFALNQKK